MLHDLRRDLTAEVAAAGIVAGAEDDDAVLVEDLGLAGGHVGGDAEADAEIPVVLQLAGGVVGRGQIGHGAGIVEQGLPLFVHQILAKLDPEGQPQQQAANEQQRRRQGEHPAKHRPHGFRTSNL